MGAQTLLLPVAALAALWIAGLGVSSVLVPRMRRDAQAAFAPAISAAAVVCTSPLALLHVSPVAVAGAVLGPLLLVTAWRARRSVAIARRAAVPAAIAAFALLINAAPALKGGTWVATSYGNADPYLWVSQAQSLSHGPPPAPAAAFPDRVSYEMLTKDHWPTGLPVGLGAVASLEGLNPVDAYEAFAAVISAVLALAVFGIARGCLRWRLRLSVVAGAVVSANGLLLLSTYFGWQAQLLLTAFGTLGVSTLPVALDRRATPAELFVPALFLAAGIATYGWVFAPFLALAAVVASAVWLRDPHSAVGRRAIATRVGRVAALALVLGLVPIVEAAWRYSVARGHVDPSVLKTWSGYAWAYPSDGLGLVVRVATRKSPGAAWTALALAVTAVLLVRGAMQARSPRNPRGYVLVAANSAAVAFLVFLAIAGSSPYTSLKLMGYAAPLLTLLALSSFAGRRGPSSADALSSLRHVGSALAVAAAAIAFVITSAFTVGYALKSVKPATVVDGVVAATERLPTADAVRIDYADAWRQSWLVYYLRDRRTAVPKPSAYLTGFAPADLARHPSFSSPASYAIAPRHNGPAVWRGAGGVLYRIGGGALG
jgi:hypothetical protein